MAGEIEYYNTDNQKRGLPEPRWGAPVLTIVQCPTCGSTDMYYSGSMDDPDEIFGEAVRCGHCGHFTDWHEAFKQRQYHPVDTPRTVIGKEVKNEGSRYIHPCNNAGA